ncbi:hypothetical protein Scep_025433 [Stephania cephalantha]|uniref:Uncharacterized protein n=1 Tax=Stephania cephalantha TaxID=152367 RepID=A0AAP0EIP3_9MAGN
MTETAARSSGSREDANDAVQRQTSKGGEGEPPRRRRSGRRDTRQRRERPAACDIGGQQDATSVDWDATSADSSDSGEPPTRTTSRSGPGGGALWGKEGELTWQTRRGTAVVRPAAAVARRPELRRGWLDGGAAPVAARRRRCSQRGEKKRKKERSFARHEISKGEFELMTPLKA